MAHFLPKNTWNWKAKVCHEFSGDDIDSILADSYVSDWVSDNESLTIGLNLRLVFLHPGMTAILLICSNSQRKEYSIAERANRSPFMDLPLPMAQETTDAELCGLMFLCRCGKCHLRVPAFKPTAVKLPLVLRLELQGSLTCPSHGRHVSVPNRFHTRWGTYPALPDPSRCYLKFEAVFRSVAPVPSPDPGILAKLHGGLLSDVTLRLGVTELRAHRGVLAAASDVFRAMFEGGHFEEAVGGVVDVADVRVEVMEAALRHTYGQALGKLGADVLVEVLVMSERYQLLELKALCEHLLSHDGTLDALQLLAVADSSRAERLKEAVITRIVNSPNRMEMVSEYSVREIQLSNPTAFKELFMRMCSMPQTK